MKKCKVALIIDAVLIAITLVVLWYIDIKEVYGLMALTYLGAFAVVLGILAIEVLALIVIAIIWIYNKHKSKAKK